MPDVDPWTRDRWSPGGGDAFLFYFAYGEVDAEVPFDRERYRTPGLPEGLELFRYSRDTDNSYAEGLEEGHFWDLLEPAFAARVKQARTYFVLHGTVTDPPSLHYLRDAIGVITFLLDLGAVAVHDPQVMKWWTPAEWRGEMFEPDPPEPQAHTSMMYSREEGGIWIHTRGMRKFGRPDISIRDVADADFDGMADVCQRLIAYQARGGVVLAGQTIRVTGVDRVFVAHLAGDEDDDDFNNVHIELEPAEP